MSEKRVEMPLCDKEVQLIKLIRELKFGNFHVFVSDGEPIRVEEVKKSIKF